MLSLLRTFAATTLVLLGLSLPTAHTSTAVPPSPRAILELPRAMPGRAGVSVIVMMKRWSPTIYVHMMKTLHSYHANHVHVFHLIPAVAATVRGSELPDLFTQPGVRTIVL